jgi:hypothetical protein
MVSRCCRSQGRGRARGRPCRCPMRNRSAARKSPMRSLRSWLGRPCRARHVRRRCSNTPGSKPSRCREGSRRFRSDTPLWNRTGSRYRHRWAHTPCRRWRFPRRDYNSASQARMLWATPRRPGRDSMGRLTRPQRARAKHARNRYRRRLRSALELAAPCRPVAARSSMQRERPAQPMRGRLEEGGRSIAFGVSLEAPPLERREALPAFCRCASDSHVTIGSHVKVSETHHAQTLRETWLRRVGALSNGFTPCNFNELWPCSAQPCGRRCRAVILFA